jgi:hypothetical protein
MPGNRKPPFLATSLAAGNTCNALLALVSGWILGQLKWDHMMITGLVVLAILLGVWAYRYEYARRHPHRGRRRTVAIARTAGAASGSVTTSPPAYVTGIASVPQLPPLSRRQENARRRRERARGDRQGADIREDVSLAPLRRTWFGAGQELMPRSEALRQMLGLPERTDTIA